MANVTIADVAADIAAALVNIAPLAFGRKARGSNVEPPYYRLYLGTESYGASQGPGNSASPRVLHTREVRLLAESWGADVGVADVLNACFITALRQVLSGANYRLNGAEWHDGDNSELGAYVALDVTVILRLNEQDLTLGGDNNATTVTPETVDHDRGGAVFGDRVLQADSPT